MEVAAGANGPARRAPIPLPARSGCSRHELVRGGVLARAVAEVCAGASPARGRAAGARRCDVAQPSCAPARAPRAAVWECTRGLTAQQAAGAAAGRIRKARSTACAGPRACPRARWKRATERSPIRSRERASSWRRAWLASRGGRRRGSSAACASNTRWASSAVTSPRRPRGSWRASTMPVPTGCRSHRSPGSRTRASPCSATAATSAPMARATRPWPRRPRVRTRWDCACGSSPTCGRAAGRATSRSALRAGRGSSPLPGGPAPLGAARRA